jgi:hypothetical protein
MTDASRAELFRDRTALRFGGMISGKTLIDTSSWAYADPFLLLYVQKNSVL